MVTRTGQEITGFNGDGFADVLWQTLNSSVVLWEMAGASITGSAQLAGPFGFWSPAVVKDFNGDGLADILWKGRDGSVVLWGDERAAGDRQRAHYGPERLLA
jgi:FG-GAP-like repeat